MLNMLQYQFDKFLLLYFGVVSEVRFKTHSQFFDTKLFVSDINGSTNDISS